MAASPAKKLPAPAASRKRLAYWFVDRVSPRHRELAQVLAEKSYEVRFFTTPALMVSEFRNRRAAILMIDDAGARQQVEAAIMTAMTMPELQGVRLVLTTSGNHPDLRQLASWGAFRDIISLDLDDTQFLRRFLFSTAGKSLQLNLPIPHLAVQQISGVSLPARIVWVSPKRIRLECRMTPPPGSVLTLSGAFAENLGVPSFTVTVEEVHKSFLLYRFSDAIVGTWTVPDSGELRKAQILDFLKAKDPGQRRRVFVAAQTNSFRTEALNALKGPLFEVKAALQKQSIVDEPRFFSPDIILIEDILARDEGFDRLKAMLQGVTNEVTVIVKGNRYSRENLQKSTGDHQLLVMQQLPMNLPEAILKRYATGTHRHITMSDPDAIHILPDDKNSFSSLRIPARLTRVHPSAVQLTLPFQIGNFGLCRIETPIITKALGRNPFGKITATHIVASADQNPYCHVIDCHLADVSKEDRRRIASVLTNYFAEQLTASLNPGARAEDSDKSAAGAANTSPQVTVTVDRDISAALSTPVAASSNERPISRKKKKGNELSTTLKQVGIFFGVSAIFGFLMWLFLQAASHDYNKSGGQYTDSLKKMAPVKFKSPNSEDNPEESSH